MFCHFCGTKIEDGDFFCRNCGEVSIAIAKNFEKRNWRGLVTSFVIGIAVYLGLVLTVSFSAAILGGVEAAGISIFVLSVLVSGSAGALLFDRKNLHRSLSDEREKRRAALSNPVSATNRVTVVNPSALRDPDAVPVPDPVPLSDSDSLSEPAVQVDTEPWEVSPPVHSVTEHTTLKFKRDR